MSTTGERRAGAARPATASVVAVKLTPNGRLIECDPGGLPLRCGERVVVQDEHATEIATVAVAPRTRATTAPLPRVLRIAEERDLQRLEAHRERCASALAFARERIRARQLPIKMFHLDLHHGAKATFYFSSDTRIDFRDLVRDLSAELHARVELRQVGAREEAKMVGGIGSCGRELCCSTFLPRFAPVSIKMAKHQNLVLNPAKVSGQCGRLKCCLVYEEASYVEALKALPKPGKRVTTPDGTGRVGDLDVLRGRVRVYFEDQPPKVYTSQEVAPLAAPGTPPTPSPEPEADDDPSDLPSG